MCLTNFCLPTHHRFVLTADAQLFHWTRAPEAREWIHPGLIPLLRPLDANNRQLARVTLPKPVLQFVDSDCGDALGVLYTDGTVMTLIICGGPDYDEASDEVKYFEEYSRIEYDKHHISSIRFEFPDLLMQKTDDDDGSGRGFGSGDYIQIVLSGEEQC